MTLACSFSSLMNFLPRASTVWLPIGGCLLGSMDSCWVRATIQSRTIFIGKKTLVIKSRQKRKAAALNEKTPFKNCYCRRNLLFYFFDSITEALFVVQSTNPIIIRRRKQETPPPPPPHSNFKKEKPSLVASGNWIPLIHFLTHCRSLISK